jgi:pyridoxine kinase
MAILSIQSHVAYGHVGNAAAVFPLQRLGIEVWPVHTVQFSAHAGYGPPRGQVFTAESVTEVVRGIEERGVLGRCDGVISGYIGTADIGAAVLDAVARVKKANPGALYCCDPVIGDADGGAYVPDGVAEFFREQAVPVADIVTPNQFELEFLTDSATTTRPRVLAALQKLHKAGPRAVLATSMMTDETPDDHLDVVVGEGAAVHRVRTPKLQTPVHGTGDLIAALFFAHYLRGRRAEDAAALACSSVFAVLERTVAARAIEMTLVAAQDDIVMPRHLFQAEPVA